MQGLDPKLDLVFKLLLTREPELLRDMLEGILAKPVVSLDVINPGIPGELSSDKQIILDIRALLADGSRADIEMQIRVSPILASRLVYYGARDYAGLCPFRRGSGRILGQRDDFLGRDFWRTWSAWRAVSGLNHAAVASARALGRNAWPLVRSRSTSRTSPLAGIAAATLCGRIGPSMADGNAARFKYQARLDACTDKPCPCGQYQSREALVGYRCIHDPLIPGDFQPPAASVHAHLSRKCSSYAVSFYTTEKAVRKKMSRAKPNYDVAARHGTRIVAIIIKPDDGLTSKPSQKHKHFDLHPYDHDHRWEERIEHSYPLVLVEDEG